MSGQNLFMLVGYIASMGLVTYIIIVEADAEIC